MVRTFSAGCIAVKSSLDLDATIDLKDATGTRIPSQIKIQLSLVSDPENDNFNTFMENVDADVSRLDGTVASASISSLGMALTLTKNIMDIAADVCHYYSFPVCHRSDLGAS